MAKIYLCDSSSDYDDNVQVVNLKNLPKCLDEDELSVYDMTSLGTLLLLEQSSAKFGGKYDADDEDTTLQRLSLAYERLHSMPKILLQELAPQVKILDISHNEFDNLDFLKEFKVLTHLICDHNNITSKTAIPFMPTLELLWMNRCKLSELYPWARMLQRSCPNLKYLSLMGNDVAPSYFNGGSFYEYLHYRLFFISLFPKLVHLDDEVVTEDQRAEAERVYYRPLVERLITKTQQNIPTYIRVMSEKMSDLLASGHVEGGSGRNVII